MLRKSVRLRGVYVGNAFAFDDAQAAYETMLSASYFAKLVINV